MGSKTILVIEDEQSLASLLSDKLVRADYQVIKASDGTDGLHKALEHHPDLILLDLVMPGMDGVSMLKKLREDSWGTKVPVIVLSNLNDSAHVFDSLDKGVLDYLVKSDWGLEDILKQIRRRLGPPAPV